jgi:hypothetical protein
MKVVKATYMPIPIRMKMILLKPLHSIKKEVRRFKK